HENTESDSKNFIELKVNLDALQKSAIEGGKEYIGKVAFPVYPQWKKESKYWNSSINNPVGAEYILMDHVHGIRLCDIW
ncbi:22981_t:CDS:2, partial [Gigaspora margarita]